MNNKPNRVGNPENFIHQILKHLGLWLPRNHDPPEQKTISAGTQISNMIEMVFDGDIVNLTPTEYDILKLFLENPGEVFPPKVIYKRVWKENFYGSESTVAVHIRHLREKLEINPAEPRYLKVVWGQGYKMERGEKI